jgi:hypothetical protein
MRRFLLATAFLFIGSLVQAQSATFSYDYLTKTPAVVATYAQSITWDGLAVAGTPTCVALGTTGTTCSITIPTPTAGNHTAVINVSLDGNTVVASKTGFNPANLPGTPGSFRIVITVTIP